MALQPAPHGALPAQHVAHPAPERAAQRLPPTQRLAWPPAQPAAHQLPRAAAPLLPHRPLLPSQQLPTGRPGPEAGQHLQHWLIIVHVYCIGFRVSTA